MEETYQMAVPEKLNIKHEQLRLRLDFYESSVLMTGIDDDTHWVRFVSAGDVAEALTKEFSYGTPVLKSAVIRYINSAKGEVYLLWENPKVRRIALQTHYGESPKRFMIPTPGLIFVCCKGYAPMVYAAKRRPTKLSDPVYRAPFANIFDSGKVCAGTHKFPLNVYDIPDSFFRSFFTSTADLEKRSVKFPDNIVKMWEYLHKNEVKTYPLKDLVQHGTLADLKME